jgi:serine/threonine protein kinase
MESKTEIPKSVWRQSIQENPYLSEDQKRSILLEMDKHESEEKNASEKDIPPITLGSYLPHKLASSSTSASNSPANSSGSIGFYNAASTRSTNISEVNSERTSSPAIAIRPRSPSTPMAIATSSAKKVGHVLNLLSISPTRENKDLEDDKSEDSKESPTSQVPRKLSNPVKNYSGSCSPRRTISSSGKKETLKQQQYFYESIPVENAILEQFLAKAKTTLNKKDGKIDKVDFVHPSLQMVTMPNRDMKKNIVAKDKTAILINTEEVEGTGAYTTVVKGYDLINHTVLAIKLFKDLQKTKVKTLMQGEMKSLGTRGWFFGFCNLQNNDYALAMKYIEGEPSLQSHYLTNDNVSQDDIWENYCTQKKELSFNFQFDFIIKLMDQLIKIHDSYKLLHNDLKPANILVSYTEDRKIKNVRIVDFGGAFPIGLAANNKTIVGTDPYIHPALWHLKDLEVLGFDKALENLALYGRYSDIYAFAILCGETLTKMGEIPSKKKVRLKKQKCHEQKPIILTDKIRELMLDLFKLELDPAQKNAELYALYSRIYSLAILIGQTLTLKGREKNFQQSIREKRKNAIDDKPMILTDKIRKYMPDVFKLEKMQTIPDKYETYADIKKNLQNYILLELKLMANKMLAIQPKDRCLFLLANEAGRMKAIKENYKLFTKEVKEVLSGPNNLETTINTINESYKGCFFQPKKPYKINKNTDIKLKAAHMKLIKESTEEFKKIHAEKEEKTGLSLTL